MLAFAFFSWWYGRGWRQVVQGFCPRLQKVSNTFSAEQLLRTLFAPWRRIITYPGASLAERVRAWSDNFFSRMIGFVVRLIVLFAAFLTLVFVATLTLLELIVWPLLPIAIPTSLILGIVG